MSAQKTGARLAAAAFALLVLNGAVRAGEPVAADAPPPALRGAQPDDASETLTITLGRQSAPPSAAAPSGDDLRAAIASTIESSPKLRAASMEAKAAETGIARQLTGYLPVVSLGAGINRGTFATSSIPNLGAQIRRTTSLNASLSLFNGGQTFYAVRGAQAQAQSAWADRLATQSDVALELTAAYLQFLLAERTTAILSTNAARMGRLLQSVRARRAEGFASDADVAQVDAELASMQQQVAEARTLAARSRASVESLAGRRVRLVAALPRIERFLDASEDGMTDAAVRDNPRVTSARHAAAAAEYTSRAAFGKLLPQVDFNARAERAYDHLQGVKPNNWQVGLQLSAPLIDAGSMLEYRQRREGALAVQLRADEAYRQTQEQTRGLWREYRGGAARVSAANRRAQSYAKVVVSHEKLFEAGVIALDTLLDKHRLWSSAEVQREQVAMQRYVTLCQLLAAGGRFETAMLGY